MTIQSLTGKTNNIVVPAKSTSNSKAKNTPESTTSSSPDQVNITAVAQEITKAFESSHSTSVINEDRVNAVKQALREGTYVINAESIAEKMIQMEQDQLDSR